MNVINKIVDEILNHKTIYKEQPTAVTLGCQEALELLELRSIFPKLLAEINGIYYIGKQNDIQIVFDFNSLNGVFTC